MLNTILSYSFFLKRLLSNQKSFKNGYEYNYEHGCEHNWPSAYDAFNTVNDSRFGHENNEPFGNSSSFFYLFFI